MITSVYAAMQNLASRKTVNGLELFNNLVKAGLVRFLNQKEEKAKTVEVNIAELLEARKAAEKTLTVARSVKSYRANTMAKKAVKTAKRVFAGLGRKIKGLGIMTLDSLKAAEVKAQAAYMALRQARTELQATINQLAQVKEGDSVRAIYSALKACRLAAFRVEQLTIELAFAKEQVAIVTARQAV